MAIKNRIMVDIETLGTEPNSAIVSIGAVCFNVEMEEIHSPFYVKIKAASCIERGLVMDAATVEWWIHQSKEAQQQTFGGTDRVSLDRALSMFKTYVLACGGSKAESTNSVEIWGNGSNFDNVLLRSAYKACGIKCPWPFWNDRCYRTLFNMAKDIYGKEDIEQVTHRVISGYIKEGALHNALVDAKIQGIVAVRILNALGKLLPL